MVVVVVYGRLAVNVVPPVTSQQVLAEDSAVGTEEGVTPEVCLTDVPHLQHINDCVYMKKM